METTNNNKYTIHWKKYDTACKFFSKTNKEGGFKEIDKVHFLIIKFQEIPVVFGTKCSFCLFAQID